MTWKFARFATAIIVGLIPLAVIAASAEPVATVRSVRLQGSSAEVQILVNSAPSSITSAAISVVATSAGEELPAQVQLDSTTATPTTDNSRKQLMLVLDASGSMAGDKLKQAKAAAKRFLQEAPADLEIGVITFSQSASVITEPTLDRERAVAAINDIRATGNTALFDAIQLALVTIGDVPGGTVVVLSDGDDTSSKATVKEAIASLKNSDVTTNFIAYQRNVGTTKQLEKLATAGSGRMFAAETEDALLSVFAQSVGTVNAMLSVLITLPNAWAGGEHTVAIALSLGDAKVGLTASIPVAAPTSATTHLAPLTLLIYTIMILIGVYVFVLLVTESSQRDKRRRIERIVSTYAKHVKIEETPQTDLTVLETLEDWIRPILERRGTVEEVALMLEGAKINRSPEQWILVKIGAALATASFFIILFKSAVFGTLIGGVVGWVLPQVFANRRRASRCKRFEENLPDSLMLMASSLRSGFSLDQAIVAAADQAGTEMSEELRKAIQEIRIGLQLEVALGRVADRVNSPDFAWVVNALRIQRKSGGNLAELLSTAAKTVRERGQLHREVQALTAEGRLSAYVLIGLPIGLFAFLGLTQPGYIEPLWSTSLGIMISIVGLAMLAIGWAIMSRMVKVKI